MSWKGMTEMNDFAKFEETVRKMGLQISDLYDRLLGELPIQSAALDDVPTQDSAPGDVAYPGDEVARAELEAAGIDVDAVCDRLESTIRTCFDLYRRSPTMGKPELCRRCQRSRRYHDRSGNCGLFLYDGNLKSLRLVPDDELRELTPLDLSSLVIALRRDREPRS